MYELGQPVTITGTAVKKKTFSSTAYTDVTYANGPLPTRQNYDNPRIYTKGVIVGARNITDGKVKGGGDDDGYYYVPTRGTSRRVWLVAFDLNMKPVMCFAHQLAPRGTATQAEAWNAALDAVKGTIGAYAEEGVWALEQAISLNPNPYEEES